MKIEKLEIRNYRSFRNVTIYPKDILALVGRNNSGKSNIIKALELFFEASTKLVNQECFHNCKTQKAIEVFATFGQLSEWEVDRFQPWIDGDKLIVGREVVCTDTEKYEINNLAIVSVPEPEWLRVDIISGEKITEWWSKREILNVNGLDFAKELGTSKPTVGQWKAAAQRFIEIHHDKLPWQKETRKNPVGYPGVLKGSLPEFIYIPAVRDITEEAKVTKTNPFGQLVNSLLERIPHEEKDVISNQLKGIEKYFNRSDNGERLPAIQSTEDRLNTLMAELMDCDVEIAMSMPQLEDILREASIFADDGVRTSIETKGHGMQRAMILTILRAYAELTHEQKAGEKAGERTTIFAIEEPELYLHPQSQRTMVSVLRNIASGKDQIVYSTQSSLFVAIEYFDEICLLRREKMNGFLESRPTQLLMSTLIEDLKARKGIDGTEIGMREQYYNAFNPMINEGFFADKVVIVEGPSEQYALPIYASALKYDIDRHNVSVVHAHGKGQMDRLLRIFTGFKIPTYLWFDGDKSSSKQDVREKTLELVELLGDKIESIEDIQTRVSENYTVLEHKLEVTLEEELPIYTDLVQQARESLGPSGKPLVHRFIASQLKREISDDKPARDVLPKTICEIVEKIRNLSSVPNILRKLE